MIKAAMFDSKQYDIDSFEESEHEGISIKYYDTKLTADTAGLASGFDCVIAFVNDTVDAEVIDLLERGGVKLVALRCAGFNNVDLKYADGKITVVRVPAYSPHAVAEHAIGMLLASVRRIHKAYIRSKDFNFSLNGLTGFNLYGKTVGIIGTGKIGRVFADICNGFGMKVLAYDLYPDSSVKAEYVSLETVFKDSDIISLHCPLTEENRYIVNSDTISLMKSNAIIINTSRGQLIDAEALLKAIKEKRIGGACLDVYEEESELFFEDNSGRIVRDDILARLISMPNVLITSHQAFLTCEALENIADTTIDNIRGFFDNSSCGNEVSYKTASVR